jgi:hypothetical protein
VALKKLFEEQFKNFMDKIKMKDVPGINFSQCASNGNSNYSSNLTSTNNSLQNSKILKKGQSANKFELEANSAMKKIKLGDKSKFKEKEKIISSTHTNSGVNGNNFSNINNSISTPIKNSNFNPNTGHTNVSNFSHSPKFVAKTLFKDKELKEHKESISVSVSQHIHRESFKEAPNKEAVKSKRDLLANTASTYMNRKELLEELASISSTLDQKFDEKFEILEKNLVEQYSDNIEDLKRHINERLVEEIKTVFIEVTLDSTNLFVQKFDEFISNIKTPVNAI